MDISEVDLDESPLERAMVWFSGFEHDLPDIVTGESSLCPVRSLVIVAFRRHTLLLLDDCLYALQATIPGLTRSDIAEVRTEQDKLHLFVAIDRTSKFAFLQLHEKATRRIAANFLRAVA